MQSLSSNAGNKSTFVFVFVPRLLFASSFDSKCERLGAPRTNIWCWKCCKNLLFPEVGTLMTSGLFFTPPGCLDSNFCDSRCPGDLLENCVFFKVAWVSRMAPRNKDVGAGRKNDVFKVTLGIQGGNDHICTGYTVSSGLRA